MTQVRSRSAFTLLEMLLVVAIIALLAALMVPQLGKQFGRSQVKVTRAMLADLAASVEKYRLDVGSYPTEDQGLEALIEKPANVEGWDGPYYGKATLPKDGWNRNFLYQTDETWGFRIVSLGADGREGGEGENADLDNRQ